jgi:CRISPR-associated protein (TIGR03986 family)
MAFPRQPSQIPADVSAHAPYNFVRLPDSEEVLQLVSDLPPFDVYDDGGFYTGEITCSLKTLTPLYTRCALSPNDFFQMLGEEGQTGVAYAVLKKNCPDPFHVRAKEEPVIPGSAIRGMIRNLLKIVGFGNLETSPKKHLAYRALAEPTSLGTAYGDLLIKRNGNKYRYKAKAGFVEREGNHYVIRPARVDGEGATATNHYRVDSNLAETLVTSAPPHKGLKHAHCVYFQPVKPQWHIHSGGKLIWYGSVTVVSADPTQSATGSQPGILVRTGRPGRKHLQYIFNEPSDIALPLPESLVDSFKAAMQDAAPLSTDPGLDPRSILDDSGEIRDGAPIFYLAEEEKQPDGSIREKVQYFGWTMMFRLAYGHHLTGWPLRSVIDFTPKPADEPDLAEIIMGAVRTLRGEDRSIASRVAVGSATLANEYPDGVLDAGPITPRILGQPKATCYPHYLVQPDLARKLQGVTSAQKQKEIKKLRYHYNSRPFGETVIRGFKMYWHQPGRTVQDVKVSSTEEDQIEEENSTQHTRMRPLRKDMEFEFTVWFENLRDYELGALLWVLQPCQRADQWGTETRFRHKLGMGKGYGMGSVKLTPTLALDNRVERYRRLFSDCGWSLPTRQDRIPNYFVQKFEEELKALPPDGGAGFDHSRIRELLTLMLWDEHGYIPTEYLRLIPENDFRFRKILPSALQVRNLPPTNATVGAPPNVAGESGGAVGGAAGKGPGPATGQHGKGDAKPTDGKTTGGAVAPQPNPLNSSHQVAGAAEAPAPVTQPTPKPVAAVSLGLTAGAKKPATESVVAAPTAEPAKPRYKKKEWIVVRVVEKRANAWVLEHPAFPNGRRNVPLNLYQHPPEPDAQGHIRVRVKDVSPDGKVIKEIQWW